MAAEMEVNRRWDRVMDDARQNQGNDSLSSSIKREGRKSADHDLSQATTPQQRLKAAAGAFMGAYLSNTRTRAEVCQSYGVNIRHFTTLYTETHPVEYQRSTALLKADGISENELYAIMRNTARQAIEQNMRDAAAALKTDIAGACTWMDSHAPQVVRQIQFKNALPAHYAALHQ